MIDARTAPPEPSLHAATLLSRTRLTQVEVAARLGISERMLRYHVAGRPMPYALRYAFERLALELETVRQMVDAFRSKYPEMAEYGAHIAGGTVDASKFAEGFDLPGPDLHFLNAASFKDALPNGGGRRLTIKDLTCPEGAERVRHQTIGVDYASAELRTHAALAEGHVRAFNFAEADRKFGGRWADQQAQCRPTFDDVYEPRMVRCPNPACNEAYSPILDACPACGHPNARLTRYRK